jgi:hypothetical protein
MIQKKITPLIFSLLICSCGSDSESQTNSKLIGTSCKTNSTCGEGLYCEYPEGTCGENNSPGKCMLRPDLARTECIAVVACGCDKNLYPTPCDAAAAGISIRSYSDLSSCKN